MFYKTIGGFVIVLLINLVGFSLFYGRQPPPLHEKDVFITLNLITNEVIGKSVFTFQSNARRNKLIEG
jgi:hypothetical protein